MQERLFTEPQAPTATAPRAAIVLARAGSRAAVEPWVRGFAQEGRGQRGKACRGCFENLYPQNVVEASARQSLLGRGYVDGGGWSRKTIEEEGLPLCCIEGNGRQGRK